MLEGIHQRCPQLAAAIAYVQRHPINEGLPAQPWGFLKTTISGVERVVRSPSASKPSA